MADQSNWSASAIHVDQHINVADKILDVVSADDFGRRGAIVSAHVWENNRMSVLAIHQFNDGRPDARGFGKT